MDQDKEIAQLEAKIAQVRHRKGKVIA